MSAERDHDTQPHSNCKQMEYDTGHRIKSTTVLYGNQGIIPLLSFAQPYTSTHTRARFQIVKGNESKKAYPHAFCRTFLHFSHKSYSFNLKMYISPFGHTPSFTQRCRDSF